MLSENFFDVCRFVVERNVRAALLHELDFLLRAGRGDDFQALLLSQLYHEPRQ